MIRLFIFCIFFCVFLNAGYCELTEYQKAYQTSIDMERQYEYSKSIQTLQAIYEKYQKDYDINLRLGYLNYINNQYEKSLEYYEKAVKIKQSSLEAQNWVVLILVVLKRWQKAEDYAKRIIKQDMSNYYANIRLAYIYYMQGEWSNALERYHAIYGLYPGDSDIRLGLASTYLALGEKIKARYYYSEILKVSPFHTTAYYGYLSTLE